MISEWTDRTQRATKANAEANGETWTSEDLAFVEAFANEASDADLALALGRTYYAITTIKRAIAAGRARRPRVAATDRPYRGWTCDMGDD